MIGLPFEKDDDVHAIVKLTKEIKAVFLEESKKQKKIGTITLSINPFIPKPATPFQWAAMQTIKILKKRVDIIRQGLKTTANVNLNIESLRKAKVHALLSKGDQKTADLIIQAQTIGWNMVMKQEKEYCEDILYSEKATDSPLPWDFLDNRVKKQFLKKEFQKAREGKKSASCTMADCHVCQICI